MTLPASNRCKTCKYSAPTASSVEWECRRYAPHPAVQVGVRKGSYVAPSWPTMAPDDWCGEFWREEKIPTNPTPLT